MGETGAQPEETEEDPAEESEEEGDETLDEEVTDDETTPEDEPDADEDTKDEDPNKEELDPEELRKQEARERYEERQRVISERRARVKEQTQDYVDAAEDETEQRLRAIEVQEYTRLIEHNENTLIGEFERVKANPELAMFNPDSAEFNQRAYDKALKDYNAGYLGYDANGNLTEIKGSLYEHLTETAELLQGAVKNGQIKQVRDSRKMKSRSETKPAATPKEIKKDTILEELLAD